MPSWHYRNSEACYSEAGEKNEARKTEPAHKLLIFEFCPWQGVKSAFHVTDYYPIGGKQNVNKYDSALHVENFVEDGQTSWMVRWFSTIDFGEFF